MSRFCEADVLAEFGDALAAAGLRVRGAPVMDGAWHRASLEGDRGKQQNGRYRGYLNGLPAGFVQNFKDETRTGTWKFGATAPAMSPAERAAAQQETAAAVAAREHRIAARQAIIARRCAIVWQGSPPAPAGHGYLQRKGIPTGALRVDRRGRLRVPMYDLAGQIAGLQTIDSHGRKLFVRGGRVVGMHLVLGEIVPDGVLLIAEGYATAATLNAATGHAVAVAFSKVNFVAIARTYLGRFPGLRIGFAGDNDHHLPRRNPPLLNVGREAAEAAARDVGGTAILPAFETCQSGSDWNDYGLLHGLDAVQAAVKIALPSPPLAEWSAAKARVALAEHVACFMARTLAWHEEPEENRQPEHVGLAVEVAAGKTTATCEALPRFIAAAKARRLPHRILFTVPTHKLGGEVSTRLAGLGLKQATWRGREAENPATGTPMCADLPAVRDAIAAGEEVESAICGKPDGLRCRFFDGCPYQHQKAIAAGADVVVAAHEAMLGRLPQAISKGFALTIADESWLHDGVEARELAAETLRAGEVEHPVPRHDNPSQRDDTATNDLHVLRRKLVDAIDRSPNGYLTRTALLAAGLTAADCSEAHKLEWRRKITGAMRPAMSADSRREALRGLRGNAAIPRLTALWKSIATLLEGEDDATGRIELGHRETAEGLQRVIRLNILRAVAEPVTALPMLLLDATLPVALLRHRLPRLTVLGEIKAAAPHMRVHQIRGGFGKTSITPHPKAAKDEARRLNRIAELRDFILLRTGGARTLVVTYHDLEPHFADLPGVQTAHFNAIAGRDEWRDVRHLFIIGRPMPAPEDTRRIAAALTGQPVPEQMADLVTRDAIMRNGSRAAIEVRRYTDPHLEAVRAAVTDAELVQVIGRGRGINRTKATPLDVHVLVGDVALPLPLDSLTHWQDAAPNLVQRMAARGVILTSPRDATRAYPDLFTAGEAAARQALLRATQAGHFCDIPLWKFSIGGCHTNTSWLRVEYRPAGRGQQTRIAWTRPDRLFELRAWLEAVTGAAMVLYTPQPVVDPPVQPVAMPVAAPLARPPPSLFLQRRALQQLGARLDAMRPGRPDPPPWLRRQHIVAGDGLRHAQ